MFISLFLKTPIRSFGQLMVKKLKPEITIPNYQDYLWFFKLRQRIEKEHFSNKVFGEEKAVYQAVMKRLGDGKRPLEFEESVETMVYLGIASQRKFCIVQAQKIFINLLQTFQSNPSHVSRLNSSLSQFSGDKFLKRKLFPNLVLSMSNLRVLDISLVRTFDQFINKFRKEIEESYFFTVHTILALIWALMVIPVPEINNSVAALNEYLWKSNAQLDLMGLFRLCWLGSYATDRFGKANFEAFLQKNRVASEFIYNFKNSLNVMQLFMNLYPEVGKDFYENRGYKEIEEKIRGNDFLSLLPELYKFALPASIVAKHNISQQLTYIEKRDGSPSFLIRKVRVTYAKTTFENRVCDVLLGMGKKFEKNVRLGIYEVDILLEDGEFAIEIDGDSHHFWSVQDGKYLKKSKSLEFKMRHLKLWGLKKFAAVSFMEWRRVEHSKENSRNFILNLLQNPVFIE